MCRALPPKGMGAVAQMVERLVRNEEVRGSIPLGSTRADGPLRLIEVRAIKPKGDGDGSSGC